MAQKEYDPDLLYISYSGYQKYLECPHAYYVEYVLRERPEVQDERNTLKGNALHQLLEEYILNGEDRPRWMLENAKRVWNEHVDSRKFIHWRHEDDKKELIASYVKWVKELVRLVDVAKIKPENCRPEFKADQILNLEVNGKVQKVKLAGRIDLLREKDNGDFIFFDLKASENRSIMKLEQITWYATLMSYYLKDDDQPLAGGYILPGFKEIKLYKIPLEAKMKLMKDIIRVLGCIQRGEFEAKPDPSKYFFCNAKHNCCSAAITGPVETGIVDLSGGSDESS